MNYSVLLLLIFTLLINSVSGQKLWQKQIEQIKPLRTSNSDVRRILGVPSEKYADVEEYETREGRFTLRYSTGRCRSGNSVKYNVEEGIVIEYDFDPKIKIKFSSLKINVSGLPTQRTNDVYPPTITYENEAKGISYDVNDNRLLWVQVYPSSDLQHLECSNQSESNLSKKRPLMG